MTKRWLVSFFFVLFLAPDRGAAEPPSLLVRVLDGDGRPVAGVAVRAAAEPEDRDQPAAILREETGPDGTARFSGLPDDRIVWVLAERRGFSPALRSFSGASEARRELRILLDPGSLAVGRVVDEDGRPVAGAEVELSGWPFGFEPWDLPPVLADRSKIRLRTGPAGRFRLRDLAPGHFELTIRHPGAAPLVYDRPVETGTSGPFGTFVLRRGPTLRGTVTDPAGRPVAGARVWAAGDAETGRQAGFSEASAVTAADGTFAVPHQVPEEEVTLWICAQGFLQGEETVPFPDEPVRVALGPAATARGRVLGPDGAPLAGASVSAEIADSWIGCGLQVASPCPNGEPAMTDADGRFILERITPGEYELVATAPGLLAGVSGKLRLEAGAAVVEQEIRLQGGATLSGRVVDPSGTPIPGAELTTWTGRRPYTATSGADGWFRLTGLPAETVKLSVLAESYERGEVNVEMTAGEVTTEVVLAPRENEETIELYGQVLGPDGSPVEGASVAVAGHRVSSAWDGSFAVRICGCRSGKPVEIVAEKRGFARGRTTVLLAGERVDGLVVRLESGTRVSGRVLGLAGGDLRDVTITLAAPGRDGGGLPLGAPASADAEGRFLLGLIPAGTWEVRALTGSRLAQGSLILEPGQTEAFVELTFAPVQEVSGQVLDPEGRPAARAWLSASDGEGGDLGKTWTHIDGTFSLRVPAGDLTLSVDHEGLRGHRSLRVEEGPVPGVEIRLERGALVRGRLLGIPPGALPVISLVGPFYWMGKAEPDGSWFSEEVISGTWKLEALHFRKDGVQVLRQTFEVPPGVAELALDLDFTGIPVVDPKVLEDQPEPAPQTEG